VAPYDEWKCKGMPFSYDHLIYDKLRKKLRNDKKKYRKFTYDNLRKILRSFENLAPGLVQPVKQSTWNQQLMQIGFVCTLVTK